MNPAWIILFAPLCAAVAITLLTRKAPRVSALLSCAAILAGFVLSLGIFAQHGNWQSPEPLSWLVIGDSVRIEFGATIDRLSILMLLVVTGVGSAIHIYSVGYMKGDPGFSRYFACLSLFTLDRKSVV